MCPTWPSKVMQTNWQFMGTLPTVTFGTIMQPCMCQRGASCGSQNTYILLRKQAPRLPRAAMCGQLLASSDPSARNLSLRSSLWCPLPLSGAIARPPMPIFGPALSFLAHKCHLHTLCCPRFGHHWVASASFVPNFCRYYRQVALLCEPRQVNIYR